MTEGVYNCCLEGGSRRQPPMIMRDRRGQVGGGDLLQTDTLVIC